MQLVADPAALIERFQDLARTTPRLRARDAAAALGVSEGELVDAKRLSGAARRIGLAPGQGFAPLLEALPQAGRVMVLTRNDHVVHERYGAFGNVTVGAETALVLTPEVDLRIFLRHWVHAFAVEEVVASGLRLSVQIFDATGTAVHKIYATEATDRTAFERSFAAHLAADPVPLVPAAPPAAPADRPDAEIDWSALRTDWLALQDTHDFFGLLRRHGVGRLQALRGIGGDLARPLAPGAASLLLQGAAAAETPIMVFTGNRGCIQIHTGPVERVSTMGPWLNVLDPDFHLHFRTDAVASAWVVRKPTTDGIVTSVEFFDGEGVCFTMVFGARKPGQAEREDWRGLVAGIEARA